MRPGGHIAIIGARSGPGGELDRRQVLQRGLRVTGINVGSRAMFEAMNRAIAANELRPVVDRIFPFARRARGLSRIRAPASISARS